MSLAPEISLRLDPDTGMILDVTLQCQITPGEKELFTDLLSRDLGIERSAIHWKS